MSTSTGPVRLPHGQKFVAVMLIPVLACATAALSGCCNQPQGRCGMPDLCDPVVMPDPFPQDQCVPPKGVDCGHYGYSRTNWRVLVPRDPQCCGVCSSCYESIPVGAENVDFQTILEDPEPADSLSIRPVEAEIVESDFTMPVATVIRESVDVIRQTLGQEAKKAK